MIKPNAASKEIMRDMAASAYSPFILKLIFVEEEIRILEATPTKPMNSVYDVHSLLPKRFLYTLRLVL